MTALGSRGTSQTGRPTRWASLVARSAALPLPGLDLRMALTEPERLLRKEAEMAKPWRCRLRLHRWQRLYGPQGRWYYECVKCGTQQDRDSMGPPNSFGI